MCQQRKFLHAVQLLLLPAASVYCCQLQMVCSSTCHYTEVSLGFKRVEHLNDVLMPQLPQYLNLLSQVANVLFGLSMLYNELHCCNLTSASPPALVHLQVKYWQAYTASWCFCRGSMTAQGCHIRLTILYVGQSTSNTLVRISTSGAVHSSMPGENLDGTGVQRASFLLHTLPKDPSPTKSMTW